MKPSALALRRIGCRDALHRLYETICMQSAGHVPIRYSPRRTFAFCWVYTPQAVDNSAHATLIYKHAAGMKYSAFRMEAGRGMSDMSWPCWPSP